MTLTGGMSSPCRPMSSSSVSGVRTLRPISPIMVWTSVLAWMSAQTSRVVRMRLG